MRTHQGNDFSHGNCEKRGSKLLYAFGITAYLPNRPSFGRKMS